MSPLTLLLVGLAAAASAAPEARIVGGQPVTIEEFPYIVAFTYFYPRPAITVQRCVGSLLSSWHVLTSAFCFTGAELPNMQIRAGSTWSLSGGTVVNIRTFEKSPSYIEAPRAGDVAVVFTDTPFGITDSINILYLPNPGTNIPDGTSVKVVSWGFESEQGPQLEILKTIDLLKVNVDECKEIFADSEDVTISDDVICANAPGRGMCMGDSGAPMVINNVVVGLSSYYEECGADEYPDVFSRIDRYTSWILEVTTSRDGPIVKSL